jgi:selenocysteine-specific elongation factor
MKSVIIGTAGHIDHGKTALVKALTGIDADRLQEEKRRGITIDLGFAHLDLQDRNGEELRLGFVDVPGHERFVRNMLAGVGGIDMVLLVIAADEGIKPQTREHFDICQLLGVRRGITVLTKADAVDKDTLEVVRLEIEDYLRGSFLDSSRAPIVAVSSLTGAGLPELKEAIARVARDAIARESGALVRLPIDRVFTMKGFGTVVTGTLISGTIHKEDELQVFPSGRRVRVRGVQVHGSTAEQAVAGQRTALNLAGVTVEDISRGMMLAQPDTLRDSKRLDVQVSLLSSAKTLKDHSRVHFHAYTTETIAEVRLYTDKQIRPGETQFAQLRLSDPILLLPGDRFIVRQFSPVVTIGGGSVLDAFPLRRTTDRNQSLEALSNDDKGVILQLRVARRGHDGISFRQLVEETGWTRKTTDVQLQEARTNGSVLRIGDRLIDANAMSALTLQIVAAVTDFHNRNPLVTGISKEELRETIGASPEMFSAALNQLLGERKLDVIGEVVRLPGRGVVMKDEELESKKMIEAAFASAGLKVPFLKDVLAGLKVDKARAQKIVTLMLRDKVLVKVSEDLVFHQSALAALKKNVAALKTSKRKIDVAEFKDLTGVSRKYAIPLLEYLDRERVTRRVGDAREIL